MKRAFEILFEDNDIMVIDKKAGVLSIPDRYHDDRENLYVLLTQYRGEIFPLHRLDKETSGVMVYAKTADAHKKLSTIFETREIEKTYLAIVEGTPDPDSNRIETYLAASPNKKNQIVVFKKGKLAITDYKVQESFLEYSLVKVNILTGRQHQIRVHMHHIGHPLAVDAKYGNREALFAYDIKKRNFRIGKNDSPRPLINRHTLHAESLRFPHPTSKKVVSFTSPLPKDMRALLNQLRKWGTLH